MSRRILIDDDAAQFANIENRLKRLEQGIPEYVHFVGDVDEPAFQNSWENYDGSPSPAGRSVGFYRDRGRVYLTGIMKTGSSGTVAFAMPDGYWPLAAVDFTEMPGVAAGGPCGVRISADGEVSVQNYGTSAVSTWCSLDGVSFRHA